MKKRVLTFLGSYINSRMKISLSFILILSIGISGCKKDSLYAGSALKNGSNWEATAYAYIDIGKLNITLSNKKRGNYNLLYFIHIPTTGMTYFNSVNGIEDTLPILNYMYFDNYGGIDVACTAYKHNYGDTSWITIDSFDLSNRVVKGRFSLSLKVDSFGKCSASDPDFIKFEQGEFFAQF
ncbi:MAG: hypothetical protein IPP77_08235 [Bacteroidetes bacterium]|nr:hypothetical protein [Bacteroidota bacterium]